MPSPRFKGLGELPGHDPWDPHPFTSEGFLDATRSCIQNQEVVSNCVRRLSEAAGKLVQPLEGRCGSQVGSCGTATLPPVDFGQCGGRGLWNQFPVATEG